MAALGRERCFLVNSVEQSDLPSDLGGIISLPFKEPPNLDDREACAKAIAGVAAVLKDTVQREGTFGSRAVADSFPRRSIRARAAPDDKGDLREVGRRMRPPAR